jgi:cytochrome c553
MVNAAYKRPAPPKYISIIEPLPEKRIAKQASPSPGEVKSASPPAAGQVSPTASKPLKVARDPGNENTGNKKAKTDEHPGREIYLNKGACAECHGPKGQQAISYYPSIAGQDRKYLATQIADIISGKRKGGIDEETGHSRTALMVEALMHPDGKARINSDDVKKMSDWLSNLPAGKPVATKTPAAAEAISEGKKLFKKCISCHGKEGKKPLKGYPYLAAQKKSYLAMQMIDIRDKIRTNGKVKTMLAFVKKLSDQQIDAIAAYLAQVER